MSFTSSAYAITDGVAESAGQSVINLRTPFMQVYGTFAATYNVECSADGVEFSPVPNGTGLTTPVYLEVPPCSQIRVNVTAFTSGTLDGFTGGNTINDFV